MALSDNEKARLIQSLRGRSHVIETIPEDYKTNLNDINREELFVPTSEGNTRVLVFSSREKILNCPLFIYIHGGGFARGHYMRDEYFSAYIAKHIKGYVVDIDYKLAPEFPYPIAFHQCYEVAEWTFTMLEIWKVNPNWVSIGGCSAGANMSAAINLKLAETKAFKFCFLNLNYGCYDMATDPSKKPGVNTNIIPLDMMRDYNEAYLDGEANRATEIYCSPAFANEELFRDFPPTLLITAALDVFNNEGLDFGRKLIDAGVTVTMRKFLDTKHGFIPYCHGKWEEADKMIIDGILANKLA